MWGKVFVTEGSAGPGAAAEAVPKPGLAAGRAAARRSAPGAAATAAAPWPGPGPSPAPLHRGLAEGSARLPGGGLSGAGSGR